MKIGELFSKLGDSVVESGNWKVTNFGQGVYMHAVEGGQVLWHEITM